jgi:hypothetical protein
MRRKIRRVIHAINYLTYNFGKSFIFDAYWKSQIINKDLPEFSVQRVYYRQLPIVRNNFWPPYKWRMTQ